MKVVHRSSTKQISSISMCNQMLFFLFVGRISVRSDTGRTTTRAVRPRPGLGAAPATAMISGAARGVETRARKRRRHLDAQAGVAIPGLPFDVVVTHVLREESLRDPADLAVLRGVSRGMRDAVDATGRRIAELAEWAMEWGQWAAVERGCLTTLRCLQRRGLLECEERLC